MDEMLLGNLTNIAKGIAEKDLVHPVVVDKICAVAHGLTKRELFAAMAMQGFISADDYQPRNTSELARDSVQCADALLKKLKEHPTVRSAPELEDELRSHATCAPAKA